MSGSLKHLFRESEWAYGFYVRRASRISTDWPNESTDCHQTGFPRSANTYSRYLITNFFPEKRFVTHIHAVASIKAALRKRVFTQVIVRDPQSSVSSLCMKYSLSDTNEALIGETLESYLRYHSYVLRSRDSLEVIDFLTVTTDPEAFVAHMGRALGVALDPSEIGPKIEQLQQDFRAKEKTKKVSGSSLPNDERNKAKERYRLTIESHPLFNGANNCYEQLVSKRAV
ncbi:MAG: hypothetical protein AAFX93_03590 [Verrucomicrobiota bacterium]